MREDERQGLFHVVVLGGPGEGDDRLVARLLGEQASPVIGQHAAAAPDAEGSATSQLAGGRAAPFGSTDAAFERSAGNDVAFRAFRTGASTFVLVEVPGREASALGALSAAAPADLAIVVVDAREGFVARSRRDAYLASVSGVRRVVFAIDGLDLVAEPPDAFARLESACSAYARRLPLDDAACIPVAAARGDHVAIRGGGASWYAGPALAQHLESLPAADDADSRPFRMPVREVGHLHPAHRGIAGTITSGTVKTGDPVRIVPAGREARVTRIAAARGDVPQAAAGESVTLVLSEGIEAARGDVICASADPAQCANQFEATLVWLGGRPMLPGRSYLMGIGTRTVTATIAPLKCRVDVDTLERLAATKLDAGDIGICQLELDDAVAFEPCDRHRGLCRFTLVDGLTGETVGAGVLHFALRRADNVHWQAVDIDKAARAAIKGQKPCLLWFTGIPASGKSTIANLVERKLHAMGRHTYLLDGDNVRHGLNKDLGFTEAARVENIRRIAEVAKLMTDAGLIVLAAFIAPFRAERRMARALLPPGEFLEIFVDTPIEVAEARDPKGLYRKARRGELANFTGIDSPYERPEHAELVIDGADTSPERAAELVVELMARRGL